MNTPTSDQLDRFARTLGDELRTARKERSWTRKQMQAQMAADDEDEMSLQTLATYELGMRRVSVNRFVELCAVLDKQADKLRRRAITSVRHRSRRPRGGRFVRPGPHSRPPTS